jgi:DNA mismatch repair protein MSH6
LAEVKKRFNRDSRIQFSHAKYRYELEIPSELVNGAKKPDDFEFTSARSGFERFHTKKIKGFVDELE